MRGNAHCTARDIDPMTTSAVRTTSVAIEHQLQELIDQLHAKHVPLTAGQVATYIPELGKANPEHFGICVVTAEGDVMAAGDCDVPFTIQSISKPFTFGMALEDLGDVTLQAHLGATTRAEHAALYRQAVTLIVKMQQRGRELVSDRYLPYGIAFDVEKLSWELQFFVKHFLEAYRGAVLSASQREALSAELLRIAEELAAEPRVFCHRDYHSRNLMLHDGQLYIIDFQDARMGPDTYDLVSLLRDSYMDFSEREVDELIAFFLALRGVGADRGGAGMETGVFRRRFDLMALQRNLKALGTFGFQTTTRGNPVYIQYIPRTLAYVRQNVERDARFARLREILSAHVDELR